MWLRNAAVALEIFYSSLKSVGFTFKKNAQLRHYKNCSILKFLVLGTFFTVEFLVIFNLKSDADTNYDRHRRKQLKTPQQDSREEFSLRPGEHIVLQQVAVPLKPVPARRAAVVRSCSVHSTWRSKNSGIS